MKSLTLPEVWNQPKIEPVYWSWGAGGYEVVSSLTNPPVPRALAPKTPGVANFWMSFRTVKADAVIPDDSLESFSGWKIENLNGIEVVSFYLKKLEGNLCILTGKDIVELLDAAVLRGFHGQPILSELFLHDAQMAVVGHVSVIFTPLAYCNGGMEFEVFY